MAQIERVQEQAANENIAAISVEGSSKSYKPAYMQTFLMTWSEINRSISEKTSPKEMQIYCDKLINFVPNPKKRQYLYGWRRTRQQQLENELKRSRGISRIDGTQKEDCFRDACLQTIAEINDYFNSAYGWEKERGICVIGPFGDARRRFYPLKLLPDDGWYKNMKTGDKMYFDLKGRIMRTTEEEDEREGVLTHEEYVKQERLKAEEEAREEAAAAAQSQESQDGQQSVDDVQDLGLEPDEEQPDENGEYAESAETQDQPEQALEEEPPSDDNTLDYVEDEENPEDYDLTPDELDVSEQYNDGK